MTDSTARRLAKVTFAFYVILAVTYSAFVLAAGPIPGRESQSKLGELLFRLIPASFAIVAFLILSRQPRNTIGWILMTIGVLWEIGPSAIGEYALSRGMGWGEIAIALSASTWAPPIGLMGTSLLLRFPTGRHLSPRWRIVEWVAAFAITAATLGIMFAPIDLEESGFPGLQNPLGIPALGPIERVLPVFLLMIGATTAASAVSLVIRFRRASDQERLQLKWLVAGGAGVAFIYIIAIGLALTYGWDAPTTPIPVKIVQSISVMSFALIPIAIGFAILKHRLFDIDIIINRAVVFAIVIGFVTAVYVGIVAGIGAAIGRGTRSGIVLPIVATAVVGLAMQPLITRARRVADRVVYGRRATPYEALAAVANPGSAAELSARVARLAVESTAARDAVMWIRAGEELRPAAWWPEDGRAPSPVRSAGNSVLLPGERYVYPLLSGSEVLGAISARLGPGEALPAGDEGLLTDLAAHAAVAMDRARKSIDLPDGVVTLLMTDVEGSTALWEEDPSAMARALADHDALVQEAVAANGGLLIKSRGEGDSTFSVFGNAPAAVTAAVAMQRSISQNRWTTPRPIRVRAAMHTGQAQVRDRDYYGGVPNRCARIRSIAHGEQTILSKSARDAVGNSLPKGVSLLDLGAHRLKDLSDPEHVFQLVHSDLRSEFPPLRA